MTNNNRNNQFSTIVIFIMMFLMSGCTEKPASDLAQSSIIPKPVAVTGTGAYFTLKSRAVIYVQGESAELKQLGEYLSSHLKDATGFVLPVISTNKTPKSGSIYLALSEGESANGDEAYNMEITKKLVTIYGSSPEGVFRGVQSLRQLFPPEIELAAKQEGPWEIATGTINDNPDYSYRGAMLDVSRHFFGVDDVKRFIDFLAYYKMNVLHLHLSDDQGWRIEIKSWPELAKHGGSTEVGGGEGGYYTQDQYSDIVNYAAERYITIIPEIDMPGHTNAALASYAELNCDGKATELYTGTRVGFSSFCTNKEITYKFLDDVIGELASLTPGPYIHIGGDESHSTKEEDYIPFMNRVQEIVKSHGKLVVGWDDISVATMIPNTIAQHWANVENVNAAVAQGGKIIMSPAKKAYLDMKYDSSTKLGLRWAGLIEVDTAYIWDPANYTPGIERKNILGIEAALWSETVTNMDEVEFMVFPRLPGYAEIGWTAPDMRDWNEYKNRLAEHGERFKAMDINFYESPVVPWKGMMQKEVNP